MPRQGDGTYVPPSGVGEIVAGATADAEDVRGRLLDLGNEITNSLAVDGQSAMSGQLTLASGGTLTLMQQTSLTRFRRGFILGFLTS